MINKIKIMLVLLFCLLSIGAADAHGGSSREEAVFSQVARAIGYYKKKTGGSLPSTWDDLVNGGHIKAEALLQENSGIDFRGAYVFVSSAAIKIEVFGEQELIVLISRETTTEGAHEDHGNDGSKIEKPGRLLVVETNSGGIEARRYSEVGLERCLKEVGVDLEQSILGYDADDLKINEVSEGAGVQRQKEGLESRNKTNSVSNDHLVAPPESGLVPRRLRAWGVGVVLMLSIFVLLLNLVRAKRR